jgi:hypothetical protein
MFDKGIWKDAEIEFVAGQRKRPRCAGWKTAGSRPAAMNVIALNQDGRG